MADETAGVLARGRGRRRAGASPRRPKRSSAAISPKIAQPWR
ncbi:hypothetical protein ACFQY7_31640 [Actinomadura luteofluorescens]